jgi:hypothetical protein
VFDQAPDTALTARWVGEAGVVEQIATMEAGQTRLSPPSDIAGGPWAVLLRP